MGSIVAVVLAVLVYGLARSEGAAPVQSPWAALVLAGLPYAFGAIARRSALLGRFARARRWVVATEASGWIAYGAAVLLFGWLDFVGEDGATGGLPDARLFLSFAPFAVYQVAAIHASVRAHGGTPRTRRHLFAFQVRMFVASVAPLALFVLVSALVGRSEWLRVRIEYVGLWGAAFTAVFVALIAWLFPTLLRWAWDTAPFPDGPRREALDVIAERAAFRPRAVRLWRTGDLIANATIIGIGARQRVVLFSDQLVATLNLRELCAVYAHEIGHAKRGHVGLFLAFSLGWVLLADAALQAALEEFGDSGGGFAATVGLGAAFVATWILAFGWLSRRAELDADLFAYETCRDLPALVSALERVGGSDPSRGGWRHFGVRRRVEFLARAAADPRFVERFRSRLRRYGRIAAVICVLGVGFEARALFAALPRDRAVAALASGDYGVALERATGLGDDPELVRLAERARGYADPSRTAAEDYAREALEAAASEDDVLEAARIASLRGSNAADLAARALEAAADGEPADAARLARGVTGPLGEALRAWIARQE